MNNLQNPTVCMKRDKDALAFALDHFFNGEPSAIVGMADMGQEIIFRELEKNLPASASEFRVFSAHATEEKNILNLSQELERYHDPSVCLINLSCNIDVSWFVEKLDKLRLERSTDFISVILSNLKSVNKALSHSQKSLTRSLFVLSPIDENDTNILIDDFTKRFAFTASAKQRHELFSVSTGYVGLLKSLFLLLKENPEMQLDPLLLLQEESIKHRLTIITNDLSSQQLQSLYSSQRSGKENDFFEKFGFTKNDTVINKLLELYLEKKGNDPIERLRLSFTPVEHIAFTALFEKKDIVISRENIAENIWRENSEEKYSDWAIDQLIHRIREKLEKTHAPYEIITKKGEGFYLKQKEA